jgi:transposase
LLNWIRHAGGGNLPGVGAGAARHVVTHEEAELSRLRRENAELRMEREILKKSAAYFAGESLRGTR